MKRVFTLVLSIIMFLGAVCCTNKQTFIPPAKTNALDDASADSNYVPAASADTDTFSTQEPFYEPIPFDAVSICLSEGDSSEIVIGL